jgi:CheY-like chemotaxis protein
MVSDIAMPDEDGYAFIREVRERGRDCARIPALALTAYGGLEERQRIMAAGFDAYLAKPVDARELVAEVRRLAANPSP